MKKGLEPYSSTWSVLKRWAAEEIDLHHVKLEDPSQTEAQTNNTRGRISQLRDLLALAEPDPVIPGNPQFDR